MPIRATPTTMTTDEFELQKKIQHEADEGSEDDEVELLLHQHDEKEYAEDAHFKEFEQTSYDMKMQKLNALVQQSQVFSNIISETLIESSMAKKKERDASKETQEPPRKKSKKGKKSHADIMDTYGKTPVSEETRATKQKLEQTSDHELMKQPSLVTGAVMRDYQLEGAEWLITLYENGLNGILADEMGLGKTIQCIALLAFLFEQGVGGPFLVTAPLSTVGNWINEIKKFAPTLPVLGYIGLKEERKEIRNKHFNNKSGFDKAIVVTSYETVLRDMEYLNRVEWKFLIVDEGHRLKNMNCKLVRELKRLKTQNRLLLTGTPLQNNLNELWSLLNFILPDIFRDLDLFQKWFDFSSITEMKEDADASTKRLIDAKVQETIVKNLHSIIKPFLLRRLKKHVLTNLVAKKEFIVYGTLTNEQSNIYKGALSKGMRRQIIKFAMRERVEALKLKDVTPAELEKFISDEVDGDRYAERTLEQEEMFYRMIKRRDHTYRRQKLTLKEQKLYTVLEGVIDFIFQKKLDYLVMQLRLICDSPYLFYFPWDDENDMSLQKLLATSAKLQLLDQLVPKLVKKGHKVLVFCQFTTMMTLIQDWCDLRDYDHCYLAGDTSQSEREVEINKFNNDENAKVFILSTRAGGLGLNLTSADSVILFDSDWNPQVDLQAMDRVHRIGQTKPVAIYRFVLTNTIEEVILAKADAKRKLEKVVIQLGKFQSLRKFISSENTTYLGDGSKVKRSEESSLASDLTRLFEQNSITQLEHDVKDNKLSEEELKALIDRSPEGFARPSEFYAKFPHIQSFETTTSLE